MQNSKIILLATTAVLTALAPAVASAQSDTLDTVIVTARKKGEELLKVPVPVSALSQKDITARGIVTMDDVAKFTPGMADDQAAGGSGRSDRSFQEIIIRGMNPSNTTNQTTSMFINGVPVSSSDFLQNIDAADRVEVLKGPQSAYFGRETFAGAVNVVTKAPSNTFSGTVSAELGTRNTRNFAAMISGPIIADKLSFLAGGSFTGHDGSYKNRATPGQTLGAQTTKTGYLSILATPINDLTIKAFGEIFQDKDGPSATGVLLTSSGSSNFSQSNCTIAGRAWFCGTLPSLNSSVSPAQVTSGSSVSQASTYLSQPGKLIKSKDAVKGFGLKRDAYHVDLSVEYALPSLGLTLTSLSGFNYNAWSEYSDLANLDSNSNGQAPGYTGFPYLVEQVDHDASTELRLSTDQSKPYRGLLGFSYVNSTVQGGLGGPQYGGYFSYFDTTGSKTTGIFFSLAYDIFPKLTINFDGRYQIDDQFDKKSSGVIAYEATYRNFVPRAILQYKITPDVMAYATYSEGVNPGTFNSQISTLATTISPNAAKYFTGQLAGGYNAQVAVKPEKLKNFELGLKGKFLDGRATLSADIYYDKWTNQLVSRSVTLPQGFTADGVVINNTGVAQLVGWTDNSGQSTVKGLEVDGKLVPVNHVTINASGAINDAKYDKYSCIPCASYTSSTPVDAAGKQLPNSSKYSAAIGAQYSNSMNMLHASDWYIRGDYIYRSGFYIDAINSARTQDTHLINLRGGINWEKVSLEGYINNLTNEKSYTAGFSTSNFSNFRNYYNAVYVGLPQLITLGAKLRYRF